MTYDEYLSIIVRRLSKNYIISPDIEEHGTHFDCFANSIFVSPNSSRYNVLPYSMYEIYEKIYIKHYAEANEQIIRNYFALMCSISSEQAPTYQHLYKSVIGVMVCDSFAANLPYFIRKLKYVHPFTLYIRGWSEVQIICVDLSKKQIFYNVDAEKSLGIFALR